jgi:hypothetical protein
VRWPSPFRRRLEHKAGDKHQHLHEFVGADLTESIREAAALDGLEHGHGVHAPGRRLEHG